MSAFIYEVILHWKLNLRSKEILVHFYVVPLLFYVFIGSIFTAIDSNAYKTIISVMTVFGISMGGLLGSPYPLVEFYGSDIKKSYQIGHIPLWTLAIGNLISAWLHLLIMSIIIFFTAPILYNAPIPQNILTYFVGLNLLIVASLGIGMIFGLFFKSSSKMGMATQIVFLPSIMLSGIMFPRILLPEYLQMIGNIFPATWGFKIMCSNHLGLNYIIPLLVIILVSLMVSIYKLKRIIFE